MTFAYHGSGPALSTAGGTAWFTSIVDKIEELTGHPCMSGTHDIIVRGRFDEIAQIQFR